MMSTELDVGPMLQLRTELEKLNKQLAVEIFERNRIEQKSRRQMRFFHSLLNSSPNLCYIKDFEGRFTFANQATIAFYGTTFSQIIGSTESELGLPLSEYHRIHGLEQEALAHPDKRYSQEETLTNHLGAQHWFQTARIPLSGMDRNVELAVFSTDITIRKEMEDEILRVQQSHILMEKLAALGNMAAGITHEINQPLNAIKLTTDSLLYWHKNGKTPSIEKFLQALGKITAQVTRIDTIIKHTRQIMSTNGSEQLAPHTFTDILSGALEVVGTQLKNHTIVVHQEISSDIPSFLCDKCRMEQVIINLLVNALHALQESVHLVGCPKEIHCRSRFDNDLVIIEICDNGPGIPLELQSKIFEPFFSTKASGKGMGLGLSIVQSIVHTFQGTIYCHSNEWGGATFRLEFPPYAR